MSRRETGIIGENLACEFLRNNGYEIIERNYRCVWGEVDIIARRGDTLVFVEVRTKTGRSYGFPEESITFLKQERMKTVAKYYCMDKGETDTPWRIDVVAIEIDGDGCLCRLELIENAVEE